MPVTSNVAIRVALRPDAVAPMAEDRRPDGSAEKSYEKDGERLEHADDWIRLRKEKFAEDQSGDLAVR